MIITRFTWFAAVVVIAHFGGVALSAAEWELVTPDSYPGLDLALAQDEPVAKADTMAGPKADTIRSGKTLLR